jgi:PadR family transcriptional regulator, regulatory protein PadR
LPSRTIPKIVIMKVYLGEFEELVLLTIATLGNEAYGVSIQQDIEARCHRSISIGALHSTITRLEEKGFLKSWMGGATQERGGRSKRYYEITQAGKKAVTEAKDLRDELRDLSKIKLAAR